MKEVRAIIRPEKLDDVLNALEEVGHPGVTVCQVEGHGRQTGLIEQFRGRTYKVDLLPKLEVRVVCKDEDVEKIMKAIRESAYTGEIGDGKIFVYEVVRAMRIRSGELDEEAI